MIERKRLKTGMVFSCWLGREKGQAVRKGRTKTFRGMFKWLLKNVNKKQLADMLGISPRTLRSYYWIAEGRKKGKWGREPSQKVKEKIEKLYWERQKVRFEIVDSEGYLLYQEGLDVEDALDSGFYEMVKEMIDKGMDVYVDKHIRYLQRIGKSYYIQLILEGDFSTKSETYRRMVSFYLRLEPSNFIVFMYSVYDEFMERLKTIIEEKPSGLQIVIKKAHIRFYR